MRFRSYAAATLLVFISAALWADDPPADTTETTESTENSVAAGTEDFSPMVEGVDIPTAYVLNPMTYSTAFRFYNEGGLMSR